VVAPFRKIRTVAGRYAFVTIHIGVGTEVLVIAIWNVISKTNVGVQHHDFSGRSSPSPVCPCVGVIGLRSPSSVHGLSEEACVEYSRFFTISNPSSVMTTEVVVSQGVSTNECHSISLRDAHAINEGFFHFGTAICFWQTIRAQRTRISIDAAPSERKNQFAIRSLGNDDIVSRHDGCIGGIVKLVEST